MEISISKASEVLNLDVKTSEVLKLVSKGSDIVSLAELVKTLIVMEFNDWDKLDEVASTRIVYKYKGAEGLKDENIHLFADSLIDLPEDSIKASYKKTSSKNKKGKHRKSRTKLSVNDISSMVKNYVEMHNNEVSVSKMAKALNISVSTARRYLIKLGDIKPKKINSKFSSYITLSEDEVKRKDFIDELLSSYSKDKGKRKNDLMKPVYYKLTSKYGIVFDQSAKEMMYEYGLEPDSYPKPTKMEIIIHKNDIYDIALSILQDLYE